MIGSNVSLSPTVNPEQNGSPDSVNRYRDSNKGAGGQIWQVSHLTTLSLSLSFFLHLSGSILGASVLMLIRLFLFFSILDRQKPPSSVLEQNRLKTSPEGQAQHERLGVSGTDLNSLLHGRTKLDNVRPTFEIEINEEDGRDLPKRLLQAS